MVGAVGIEPNAGRNLPQVCKEGQITIQPYKYCSEFLADRWPTSDVPSEATRKSR